MLFYKHLALESFLEPLMWLYLIQAHIMEFVVLVYLGLRFNAKSELLWSHSFLLLFTKESLAFLPFTLSFMESDSFAFLFTLLLTGSDPFAFLFFGTLSFAVTTVHSDVSVDSVDSCLFDAETVRPTIARAKRRMHECI